MQRARRESFQRRERERIEQARRRFEEEIARTQREVERWAKEGSYPRTRRERAIRAILKFWELWAETSANWDETHKKFERLVRKRMEIGKDPAVSKQALAQIDKDLVKVLNALQQLDEDFFARVTAWTEQAQEFRERLSWRDPSGVAAAVIHVARAFFLFASAAQAIETRRQTVEQAILQLDMRLSVVPGRPWGPPQPSYQPAD